jgi:hypothetical protein
MNLVYNIDLITGNIGGKIDLLPQVANLVNAPIAGSIYLYYIQASAFSDLLTYTASITWLASAVAEAVHCLSQNTPRAGLACPPRATEEIGMCYPPAF